MQFRTEEANEARIERATAGIEDRKIELGTRIFYRLAMAVHDAEPGDVVLVPDRAVDDIRELQKLILDELASRPIC